MNIKKYHITLILSCVYLTLILYYTDLDLGRETYWIELELNFLKLK